METDPIRQQLGLLGEPPRDPAAARRERVRARNLFRREARLAGQPAFAALVHGYERAEPVLLGAAVLVYVGWALGAVVALGG